MKYLVCMPVFTYICVCVCVCVGHITLMVVVASVTASGGDVSVRPVPAHTAEPAVPAADQDSQ